MGQASRDKCDVDVSTVSSLTRLHHGGVETMPVKNSARTPVRLALAALTAVAIVHAVSAGSAVTAFVADNHAAMRKMMSAMDIKSSGDIDRDFAEMMIAHHQGAIDMAQAELRYGTNEQLRRIAQEIIVDQLQEIAAMRMALNQSLPPMAPAPTQETAPSVPPASTDRSIPPKHPD